MDLEPQANKDIYDLKNLFYYKIKVEHHRKNNKIATNSNSLSFREKN